MSGAKFTVFVSPNEFKLYELPADLIVLGNQPVSMMQHHVDALVKLFRKGQSVNVATHDMAVLHELDLQLDGVENVRGVCLGFERTETEGPIPEPCPPLDFALEQYDRMVKKEAKM